MHKFNATYILTGYSFLLNCFLITESLFQQESGSSKNAPMKSRCNWKGTKVCKQFNPQSRVSDNYPVYFLWKCLDFCFFSSVIWYALVILSVRHGTFFVLLLHKCSCDIVTFIWGLLQAHFINLSFQVY